MSNIAIGAASGAAAGAAAGRAAARRVQCEMIVKDYDAHTATVEQKRDYADCVETLYPDPLTPGQAIVIKVVIVLCLLSAVAGAKKGADDDGIVGACVGFVVGIVLALLACGVVAALFLALAFLFS